MEALIGPMKVNGVMDRNWLKGTMDDAILCAAGRYLRLLVPGIADFFATCSVGCPTVRVDPPVPVRSNV